MSDKYLKQSGSGHIYIWTATLAKRNDMQQYDPDLAKPRIAALQKRLAESKARSTAIPEEHRDALAQAQKDAKTITELETAIDAQETAERRALEDFDSHQALEVSQESRLQSESQAEVERKDELVKEDPQIKKIMGFKKEGTIEAYLLENFGECPEIEGMNLQQIKNFAIQKRQDQLFEIDEAG